MRSFSGHRSRPHKPIFWVGWAILIALLSLHWVGAEQTKDLPTPTPTNAVKLNSRTFTVKGEAPVKQGVEEARRAALLDGYRRLLLEAAGRELILFPPVQGEEGFRFFRVDRSHPNPALLSWLCRAKVLDEKVEDGTWRIRLESPGQGELVASQPEFRALLTEDVDRDGRAELVAIGYDGSISVFGTGPTGSELLARTPSFGSFETTSGPGLERVRTHLPTRVGRIEGAGEGYLRVVVDFESLEAVNGELIGLENETREILVSLGQAGEAIEVNLEQPQEFSRVRQREVEIKGTALSKGSVGDLVALEIEHNGELAWRSPEGLKTSALAFDLSRPLRRGWNLLRMTADTQSGQRTSKEIWLESLSGVQERGPMTASKRAVVLTLDQGWREAPLTSKLAQAGFPVDRVTVLDQNSGTAERLLSELRNGGGADDLLFYCEAKSTPSLAEGKNLDLKGREVAAREVLQAVEAGGYKRMVAVFHLEPQKPYPQGQNFQAWQDTDRFLSQMASGGRLLVGNLGTSQKSLRAQRQASRGRLEQALGSRDSDSTADLRLLFDSEDPTTTMFRGWLFGPPLVPKG